VPSRLSVILQQHSQQRGRQRRNRHRYQYDTTVATTMETRFIPIISTTTVDNIIQSPPSLSIWKLARPRLPSRLCSWRMKLWEDCIGFAGSRCMHSHYVRERQWHCSKGWCLKGTPKIRCQYFVQGEATKDGIEIALSNNSVACDSFCLVKISFFRILF
jgi:hypothetical protein